MNETRNPLTSQQSIDSAGGDGVAGMPLPTQLLRAPQCTSLHPRLALLTGTLERALDDLWHTSILTVRQRRGCVMKGKWKGDIELNGNNFLKLDKIKLRT